MSELLDSLPRLLLANERNFAHEVAMREKKFGIWRCLSWAEVGERTRFLALGLAELQVGRESVVGLIGDNRPDWVMGEIAAHALGALSLGMYRDALDRELAYLIAYAGVHTLIVEDEEQVDKILNLGDAIPTVIWIVYADPRGMRKYSDSRLISLEAVLEKGRARCALAPQEYERKLQAIKGTDVAILCATSGTTSHPKLSMIAAKALLDHTRAYLAVDPKGPEDDYVSVLPLPWIMEQIYAVAKWLLARMTVNFVEEPETMMADMREIGPTFLLLAPRAWEAIAAEVRSRMMDASAFKRWMYELGMRMGIAAVKQGKHSILARFFLFSALKDRLGFTRLRSAATGGAALGPESFRFFQAMGVPLRQLYGQTETIGAYTLHRVGEVDFDTVGVAFNDQVRIRIDNTDENGVGEIVASHENMFSGYYRNEKASLADMEDGWMHTGDAGYFDARGHLVVVDRLKDLAKTAQGYRFSPAYIENKLKFSPYIAEAVIVGAGRDYLAAIICIRFSTVSKWAEKRRLAFTTYSDLAAKADIYELIRQEVAGVNESLNAHQKIAKFLLLYKELDADDGELTRTRKVRRGVVAEKYADIIAAMYSGADSVQIDTTITFQDGNQQRIRVALRVVELVGLGAAGAGQHAA